MPILTFFSVGEEWNENPETYESSFYKRTLDNEIYIFTAPSFNSKFLKGSNMCACVHTSLCMMIFTVAWHRAYPALCIWTSSRVTGKDHTLRPLISLSLIPLLFPLCLSALISTHPTSLPSLPPYVLPAISTDLSNTHQDRQMSV